mgnify:FL=1
MLRIALCDDDLNFMQELQQNIMEWYQGSADSGNVSITKFSDSNYLARTIDSGSSFDVFFVDIEMPQMDGLELAEHIRTHLPVAMIIFLTSHSEFSMEGYKFGALRYIPKLDMAWQLPEALTAVQAAFTKLESRFLTVRRYSDIMRVPYQEIVYVRHVLRTSQISTLNLGVIKDGRGLKEIHEQLGDERFIYIDRSTFVNLDHIRQIKGSEVVLRNSEHLPISRQMLTKVKYTINRLWGD